MPLKNGFFTMSGMVAFRGSRPQMAVFPTVRSCRIVQVWPQRVLFKIAVPLSAVVFGQAKHKVPLAGQECRRA